MNSEREKELTFRFGDIRMSNSISNNSFQIKIIANWQDIPWNQVQEFILIKQQEIAVAYLCEKSEILTMRQLELVNSFEGCCAAVRRVVTNPGGKTAGIDGIIWDTPQDHLKAAQRLHKLAFSEYKASPVRRVWIPKSNGKKRPLGIPTIEDRAIQTLWAFALLLVAECTGDRNSYGYRPYRSTQDAMQALYLRLGQRYGPEWVLEADI